ncbi:sigma factor [Demequina litorisediminis]|uniref:RNA polymerase sigma-70 region 2 domain-containing protein n=1 Tax=Demequina litorisediminis TaxID=1849022 RepID=A0ABQ6IC33_9MICO|nr:sigma factor [Demequina litorisediminis]GMA35239.1 hypothetical protein GCM10025876_14430 [Demequina litorisediminis]
MADDSDLVAQVLRDGGARLASYGLVLTGSPHDAEELVQAAIVKTFVKRRRLRDPVAAEAYVRATMRTLYIDGVRRERTWGRLIPSMVRTSHLPDSSAELAGHDHVARALAEPSPPGADRSGTALLRRPDGCRHRPPDEGCPRAP